jgi:membrane protease YdiL (CAAX protease family)
VTGSEQRLGELQERRERLALFWWLVLVLVQVALAFSGGGTDSGDSGQLIYRYSTAVGGAVQSLVLIGLALWIGTLFAEPARALGFNRFSLRALLPAAGVVVAAVVVAAALEPVLHAGEKQGLAPDEWRSDRIVPFALNTLLFVVLGPFTEELVFRGLGVRALRRFGLPVATLGSALAWGLAHGLLVALPPLLVLGVGFACVRDRTDSVWPAVIAHGAYNGVAIALSFAGS